MVFESLPRINGEPINQSGRNLKLSHFSRYENQINKTYNRDKSRR